MKNISSVRHAQFLKAAQQGELDVSVHRKLAAKVMRTSLIPDNYRIAYRLWAWVWISMLPLSAVIGHYHSWWYTPLVLLALLFGYSQTVSNSAAKYVFDYARESELFYDIIVQLGIMTVHPTAESG